MGLMIGNLPPIYPPDPINVDDEPNYPEDYECAREALELLQGPVAPREDYLWTIRYFINPDLTADEINNMSDKEFQDQLDLVRQQIDDIQQDA